MPSVNAPWSEYDAVAAVEQKIKTSGPVNPKTLNLLAPSGLKNLVNV
jgi:hypothetical protein